MACGLPVVTTTAGGITELVRHEVNGLLAAPGDLAAIADALCRLLTDAGARSRLGTAARRTVELGYDTEDAARRLEGVLVSRTPQSWSRPDEHRHPAPRPRGVRRREPDASGGGPVRRSAARAGHGTAARRRRWAAPRGRATCSTPSTSPASGPWCSTSTPAVSSAATCSRCRTSATGEAGVVVAPGVRIAAFPHDPDLPSLPLVVDPARLGPVLADALSRTTPDTSRRGARCRTTLLRYRPGKRATLRVTFVGSTDAYVAKAYHDPRKAAAVAEEAPALAGHAEGCGTLRIPATVAHLPRARPRGPAGCAGRAPRGVRWAAPCRRRAGSGSRRTRCRGRGACAGRAARHAAGDRARAGRSTTSSPASGARAAGVAGADPRLGRRPRAARRPAAGHPDTTPGRRRRHGARRLQAEPAPARRPARGAAGPRPPGGVGPGRRRGHLPGVASAARRCGRRGAGRPGPGRCPHSRRASSRRYLEARGDATSLPRIRWQEAVALERKALRAWARAPGSPMADGLVREANTCLDRLTETR